MEETNQLAYKFKKKGTNYIFSKRINVNII